MNIYIGNIPRTTDEQTVRSLFEEYGEVSEVKLLKDQYSGELRGFGFITMDSQEEAEKAIEGINSTELDGRTLVVNKARPRGERSGNRQGQGGGGGYRNSRSW
ncbi:MAG: RNA-binding protein [Calditrichaeota bacterium]|nr:RNA-binding protein [Calditrichota bacterium]